MPETAMPLQTMHQFPDRRLVGEVAILKQIEAHLESRAGAG